MAADRARAIVTGWTTVRYELLNTRVCDLGLTIGGSPIEPLVQRVNRELAAKKLAFRPLFYLSDSWGCPNEVPAVGIPFYLADKRLERIEEEQTGDIEDARMILTYLRHEVGHAFNYAYRLWEEPGWSDIFGRFSKAYRDTCIPNPASRDFVRHIIHSRYGRYYAQKHPDEDFAETFAVWLTPRSRWRSRYRFWPALRKLRFVSRLISEIGDETPVCRNGPLLNPVECMNLTLAQHYGQRVERYRAEAQGYIDDKLRQAFSRTRARVCLSAGALLRKHRSHLIVSVQRWSGLETSEVEAILDKMTDRADALKLSFPASQSTIKLAEMSALATALAMDFTYTGQFTN